ncbi:MAG: nitrous oxide-stimulated promoter family protein [Muribaculaceae bacterium]|nr:nitrous oxide-stimulated promoter family protein [Muribaculaceae bacterium]
MTHNDEIKIVTTMVTEYCHRKHHSADLGDLCPDCQDLLDYAIDRLNHCPRHERRASCRKCVIHCYSPSYRESIRQVMACIGPRMIYLHPVMAVRHMIGEMRARH